MACNGFNHPPDCTCSFRGGHPGSHPPPRSVPAALLGDLAPVTARPRRQQIRPCPRCGLPTIFVKAPNGGYFRVAGDGSFLKHSCPKSVPTEKLKLRRDKAERDWFPITARTMNTFGPHQLLQISSLLEGAPFLARLEDGVRIDTSKPVLGRWLAEPNAFEITYRSAETGSLSDLRLRARRE